VHGANRLASNSLLEGLVFGALAAEAMSKVRGSRFEVRGVAAETPAATIENLDVEGWIETLRELTWRDAGLLRDGVGLRRAQERLAQMRETGPRGMTRRAIEARNLHAVAEVLVQAALGRDESRGAHFRTDFPQRVEAARHSVVRRDELSFTRR
jgi:L-aspartate oxidase